MNKQNDMFVAVLQNPDTNEFDLAKSDIIPDNTQLLDMDTYKNLPKVKEIFTKEDGTFDEDSFKVSYQKAVDLYTNLALDKSLASALEYDPQDFTAPQGAKKVDVTPKIKADFNPYKLLYSRTGINSIDDNNLSLRELAQQGNIYDVETGEWLDKSANELGWFGTTFNKTLVYAQWDEDTTAEDPFTGKVRKFKKGDWKYDKNGSLYIETLGKREIYGKQIVNPSDLLTEEGTWINSVDFFDSDGKNKSLLGTTLKTVAEIAPLLIPVFNVWYGGFKMVEGLASVLPTFYKAGEGIFLGEHTDGVETPMWKAMNSMEGFMSKYVDKSLSDEAQKSMWNYEQLGNLVADVFTQIYEQRAAASVSKLFYKAQDVDYLKRLTNTTADLLQNATYKGVIVGKEAETIARKALGKVTSLKELASSRSKLAKGLSLGYMALTQSADVYGAALSAGYDRRTAGFTTLLAASGQYALMMNNRMGDWFLDETTGYTEGVSRASMTKLANSYLEKSAEGIRNLAVNKQLGKAQLGNVFKSFKRKLDDWVLRPLESSKLAEDLFKKGVIEGVEEVTEELAIDAAKGIADVFSAMGFTAKQGSFGGFDNVFSSQGFQRYLLSFVGGAIGGAMFEMENKVISPLIQNGSLPAEVKAELIDIVSDNRLGEFIDVVNKNKHRFGSTTLSPILSDVNGKKTYLPAKNISQADVIAKEVIQYAKHLDKIINAENLGESDEDIIRKSITDDIYKRDLEKSGVDRFILSDARQLIQDITVLNEQIQELGDAENANKQKSELKAELEEKRKEYTDLITGEKEEEYHKLSLFALNPTLHTPFLSLTTQEYIKEKYNEDYYSLEKSQQEARDKEFKELMDSETDYKNKMKFMFKAFLSMNKDFSKSLVEYDKSGYSSVRSQFYDLLHNVLSTNEEYNSDKKIPLLKALTRLNTVNKSLEEAESSTHKLHSQTDVSVGKFLVDNGFIEVTADEAELRKINTDYYNKLAEFFEITKENEESDEEFALRVMTTLNESPEEVTAKLPLAKQEQAETFVEELNKERNAALEKGRKPTEGEKEVLIKQIDRIGMPAEEFNLKALQEQIGIFLEEEKEVFAKMKEKIDKDTSLTPEQRLEAIAQYVQIRGVFPNFKVNSSEFVSPKRTLLLEYAEKVIENGESLDKEVVKELQQEVKVLEDAYDRENAKLALTGDETAIDLVEEQQARLEDILKYQKNKENILYEKLRKFEIALFGATGPVSIFEILKSNTDLFGNITNAAEFKRTEIELEQIKKAVYVLNAVKAVISAMSTTKLGPSNLYGYNVALNETIKKEGKDAIYELLGDESSALLLKDLELIENKLNYFKLLAENNNTTIPEHQARIQKAMISGLITQSLDENYTLSLVNLKVNGISLFGVDDLDRIEKIENEEQKLIEIENTFYKNFHKLKGTLTEKLDDLFAPFKEREIKKDILFTLNTKASSNLSPDFTKLEDFDWYKHVHYILAYNSNNFYLDYEKALKKELTLQNQKAPFYTQQFILRQALSYFENKKIVSHIIEFLQEDIEASVQSDADYSEENKVKKIQQKITDLSFFGFGNLMTIVGSAGTGKSSVLGNLTLRMLLDTNKLGEVVDLHAVAPTVDTLKTLTKDIKGELTNEISEHILDDFLQTVLTVDGIKLLKEVKKVLEENELTPELNKKLIDSKYFIIGEGDGAILLTQKFYKDFLLEFDKETPPKVLILDEMSKYTTLEWQILNKLAEPVAGKTNNLDNFYIILMGDDLQNGIKVGKNDFNLDTITVSSSVKLKNPIRSKNIHVNRNNVALENKTLAIKQKTLYKLNVLDPEITLTYFEKEENHLVGTKFSNAKSIKEIEKDIKKLDPEKEIVIIGEEIPANVQQALINVFGENTSENRYGKKEIKLFNEVLGREFDQVIIVSNLELDHPFNTMKNLYTLLSRAKEATLVLSPFNLEGYKIENTEANYTDSFEMDKGIITDTLKARLAILEKLLQSLTKTEPIKTEPTQEKITEIFDFDEAVDLEKDEREAEEKIEDSREEESDEEPEIEDRTDQEKEDHETKSGNILGYSFFNNIGILGEEINAFLDYTIVFEGSPENEEIRGENGIIETEGNITWSSLKEKLGEITGTDLFSLPIEVGNKKLHQIISEYVAFKNHLLFNAPDEELFNLTYTQERLIAKRLDKYSPSYQKLVRSETVTGPIYVLGRYIKLKGSEDRIFITLAVLPNKENGTVLQALGEEGSKKLNEIYDKINAAKNQEMPVSEGAVNLELFSVQVPKNNSGKTKIPPVAVSDIKKTFPGISISEIRVFRDNVDFIKKEITKYHSTKSVESSLDYSKYRFRPYIIISYVDGIERYEKLVVLQTKHRSFNDFWVEFTDAKLKVKDKNVSTKTAHLISKYRAWEVLFDFFNSIPEQETRDKIAKHMIQSAEYLFNGSSYIPYKKAITALAESNNKVDFYTFVKNNEYSIKQIFLDKEDELTEIQYKLQNPMFLLHFVQESNWIKKEFTAFKENYDKPIYYNTILESIRVSKTGKDYGTLNKEYEKYYTMNFAIEPNKISINMDTMLEEIKKSEVKSEVEPTIEPNTSNIQKVLEVGLTKISIGLDENSDIPIIINTAVIPEVEKQDKLINTMHETAMATASNYAWELDIDTGEYYFEDDEGEQVLLTDVLKTIYNSSIYNWSARTSSFRTSREFIINLGDENNNETKCNWYE